MNTPIDITFDFRTDTPEDRDPDALSPTLRSYHKLLWSKPLPDGKPFDLSDTTHLPHLHHKSELGEFFLSSDTTNSSYKQVGHLQHIRSQIPGEEMDRFRTLMYSIGNMIIFPGRKVDGKWTINQARGCYRSTIGDRFDLTLECIRRHFQNQTSPLADTLNRYSDFFRLFPDFRGYVDFFLLHDLVTDDCSSVRFFLPFIDFGHRSPYPSSVVEFEAYMQGATQYIKARNKRIHKYAMSIV
jgi:hypothetical protein